MNYKYWCCEKCHGGVREDVEAETHLMVADDETHKRCGGKMVLVDSVQAIGVDQPRPGSAYVN